MFETTNQMINAMHVCLSNSPSLASPMGHERTLNPTVSKASICLIVTWQR
jgi:hypothetical protein